jgi:hypothetical protein
MTITQHLKHCISFVLSVEAIEDALRAEALDDAGGAAKGSLVVDLDVVVDARESREEGADCRDVQEDV